MVQIAKYFEIVELPKVLCHSDIIWEINHCMSCLSLVLKSESFILEREQVLIFFFFIPIIITIQGHMFQIYTEIHYKVDLNLGVKILLNWKQD